MKKTIGCLLVCCLLFIGIALSTYAESIPPLPSYPIMGEAELGEFGGSGVVHVDWVISDLDLVPGSIPDSDFHFGDVSQSRAQYNSSNYFYYYQIENTSSSFIERFTLHNIDPTSIITCGWIDDLDLDVSPLSHTLIGEDETASAASNGSIVNPFAISFGSDYTSWSFLLATGNEISQGDYSTTLFLSTTTAPIYTTGAVSNGSTFFSQLAGVSPDLPISAPISEPMTMVLFASGLTGIWLRQKNR